MFDEIIEAIRDGEGYAFSGIILSDGKMAYHLLFPNEEFADGVIEINGSTVEDWQTLLKELDDRHVAITDPNTLVKTFVRKSQRTIEEKLKWEVYHDAGYKCEYCYITRVPFTVDHYVPQEKGGESVRENLKCACRPCNKKKGNMTPEEWEAYRIEKGIGY